MPVAFMLHIMLYFCAAVMQLDLPTARFLSSKRLSYSWFTEIQKHYAANVNSALDRLTLLK